MIFFPTTHCLRDMRAQPCEGPFKPPHSPPEAPRPSGIFYYIYRGSTHSRNNWNYITFLFHFNYFTSIILEKIRPGRVWLFVDMYFNTSKCSTSLRAEDKLTFVYIFLKGIKFSTTFFITLLNKKKCWNELRQKVW